MNEAQMALMPPEYQARLAEALRQKQLSDLAMQQNMGGFQNEMVSGRVVKRNPLEFLAKGLGLYLANKGSAGALKQASGVQAEADEAMRAEQQQVLGAGDPQQQIAMALASKFPQLRSYGSDLQKRQEARAQAVAGIAKDVDPLAAVKAAQTGNPNVPVQITQEKIEYGADPRGNTLAFTRDPKGKIDFKFAPQPPVTKINLPGREGEKLIDLSVEDLKGRRDAARNARDTLTTNDRVIGLLAEGAKAGGGQTVFQAMRKFGQAVGVEIPETGLTDALRAGLSEAVLDNVKKLGVNPTDSDRKFVAQAVGSIDTDPNALARLTSWTTAQAIKSVQDFQAYVNEAKKGSQFPGMYAGQTIGVELPKSLSGPQWYQMMVMQELQRQGGDVSAYRDPSGQQFNPAAQFDIRGPLQGVTPQGATKPRTEADIRKQYGLD